MAGVYLGAIHCAVADIDAPADKVFDYLAPPANRATIDASGMLRGSR